MFHFCYDQNVAQCNGDLDSSWLSTKRINLSPFTKDFRVGCSQLSLFAYLSEGLHFWRLINV